MLFTSGSILAALIVLVVLLFAYRHLTKKVGSNEALIVFGGRGTKIIVGGSAFVNPITEKHRIFPLELMAFEVAPSHQLYTSQGIAVQVEAIAQIKVRADEPARIRIAAEQFLSKTREERELFVRQLMEGHLRHIVGHLTVEDLVKNTDYVAQQMTSSASSELEKMGLVILSFTLKQVREESGYIDSLGKLKVAEMRKQAEVAAAQAQRDIAVAQAVAYREAVEARSQLPQEGGQRGELFLPSTAIQAQPPLPA